MTSFFLPRSVLQSVFAVFIALFSIAACAQSASPNSNNPSQKQRLVIQMSDADPAKWNLALNNAKNVQEDLGADKVDVEIVAYGPGIGLLKLDSVVNSRISEASKAGVAFVACENTMRNQKLVKADMHPASRFEASGVVTLMRRQGEGWAYIRP